MLARRGQLNAEQVDVVPDLVALGCTSCSVRPLDEKQFPTLQVQLSVLTETQHEPVHPGYICLLQETVRDQPPNSPAQVIPEALRLYEVDRLV